MSETFRRGFRVAADHPAFDGHFPGQPILPGVALMAEAMEAARAEPALAAALGTAPRVVVAKFLAPVRPGTELRLELRLGTRHLDWACLAGERTVASGQFARADGAAAAAP